MWETKQEKKNRGQSSPIAVVLVFGLVIASTTIVVLAGGSAIQDTQSQLGTASAENSMTQLDSQASLVALGQSGSQRVDFGSNGDSDYEVDESAGKMTVTHHGGGDEIFSKDMGAVTYESDDGTTIAYQGGGVWRSTGAGESVMVSPPEFHYRGSTLTLPVVTINHGEQITDRAVIRRNNTTQYYPNQSMSNVNPVETGKVSVTVQSEYYRAWGEYFEERTDGTVDYPDSQPNTVRLNLTVPSDGQTVDGAIVSGGSGTAIELKAKTGVDSYNSKISDYASSSPGNNGDIYTAGEVDFKNDAILNGSLVIEDELTMKSDSEIRGDLTHGGDIPSDADSNHVVGTVGPGADVPDPKPVDGEIERKINTFETTNDNSTHSGNLTALDNGDPCTPCNLTAGQYYVEDFTADGTVYLKPDGGTVQIAVNNDFTVKNSGTVEVIGDGRVEFYVEDEGELENSAKVTNKGDNAPQFWLYMKSDESYTAKKGDLTGVVYGPKNASRGTTGVKINMKQDSQTYGALVGEIENIDNNADIHYDTALSSTSAVDTGESTVPTLTYLHISTNEINITSK